MVRELITFKEKRILLGVIGLACALAKHSVKANSIVKGFEINLLGKDRDTYCHAISSLVFKNSRVLPNERKNYRYTAITLTSGKTITISHVGSVNQKPSSTTYRQGLLFPMEKYPTNQIDFTLAYTTDPKTKEVVSARILDCITEEVILVLEIPRTIKNETMRVYEILKQQGHSMIGFTLEGSPFALNRQVPKAEFVISAKRDRILEAVDEEA